MSAQVDLTVFSDFPGDASLRIVPIEGGLEPGRRKALLAILGELFGQWHTQGAITTGQADLTPDGSFLIIAWVPANPDLSGCTKDQLTHLIQAFEKQSGQRMLEAPRLAVELNGKVEFLDHARFRELRQHGEIDQSSVVYDMLIDRVDKLREGAFRTTVGASWYARIGA